MAEMHSGGDRVDLSEGCRKSKAEDFRQFICRAEYVSCYSTEEAHGGAADEGDGNEEGQSIKWRPCGR